jgi:hypothetical protein
MRSPRLCLMVGLLLASGLGGGSPASAEPRIARGKSVQAKFVARSEIPLGDMTTGRLESLLRTLRSESPEWNNARVFSVRFSDPQMRQNRVMRGQMVIVQPGGDEAVLEYQMTWKGGQVETPFELSGRFVHGTGRFAGIKGHWRERGVSGTTEDTSEWEVEYELP